MQVSLETTEGLGRSITVEVPSDEIDTKITKKLDELSKSVKLQGFRPGKVPVSEVKKRFGKDVRQEVISDLMKSTLFDALKENDVEPADMPIIENAKAEEGENLVYTANFDVLPEFTLNECVGIKVSVPVGDVKDKDVDTMILKVRGQHASFSDVDRKAKNTDKVIFDFKGMKDGVAFDGGTASDYGLVLGSKSMIPGFEEGLVGLKKDDEKKIELTFPEEYHSKDLAGAPVTFEIKMKRVQEEVLPEFDSEFAKKLSIKDGSVEKLTEEIKTSMGRELEMRLKNEVKKVVFDTFCDENDIELPQSRINREINFMKSNMQKMTQKQGGTLPEMKDELFKEEATKRVKLGILLNAFIKNRDLKVDGAKVRQLIEQTAASYDKPEEVMSYYYQDPKRLEDIESMVLEGQVVDELLKNMTAQDVKKGYDEVMHPAKAD